jgi:hypothetical protein
LFEVEFTLEKEAFMKAFGIEFVEFELHSIDLIFVNNLCHLIVLEIQFFGYIKFWSIWSFNYLNKTILNIII